MDGSCEGASGRAGVGGLLRDSNCRWISGFASHIDDTVILRVVLKALRKGLHLAWQLGLRELCCYTDSLLAKQLLDQLVSPLHQYVALIQTIKDILWRDWSIQIRHILC